VNARQEAPAGCTPFPSAPQKLNGRGPPSQNEVEKNQFQKSERKKSFKNEKKEEI